MTGAELTEWRKRMKLTKVAAAAALGLGRNSIPRFESGEYPVPKTVALACAAISFGLPPYGSPEVDAPAATDEA